MVMTTNQSHHSHQSQSILLAGAGGVLGRHTTRALTEAGHKVTGLGRGRRNDLQADLMNRDALLRAVEGHHFDTVIHAATALSKPPMRHRDMHATNALRVDGTAHLIEAARATGARRFVAESMVFGYGYGDHGDHVITEDDLFGPRGRSPELEGHIAAMRVKERLTFGATDMAGIALRFGLFYGPGGTDGLLSMLRKRQLPVPADHGRVLPWIELTDAARAVVAAVERGHPGRAYNIADRTPMGFGAHVRCVAEEFGLPRPMTVPLWLMRPMSYAHTVMSTTLRVSIARAERELGWSPAHPTVRDGLAAMRAAEGLT
ncbi:NAD-dependent epimerase/dehydratase family protein [Streptomyces viridochromogenes]|uniref:Putative NAD-dependent epimerase/dehydratase n=1 Tax=Streptomyces viridochromogenes Tue57 TaxID=1160705 RepID=L8P393_STRVR|nr:NAD(P)-dependent oxidoreductase [Streptomyces viridochromogenes]ELS50624.1 putative NAD-dependent epimerase/dehydratase [Streptomyces viridochromogenes Tue57]